ncbi:MAG: dienelactone hydrolase family protein [Chloroflexi bacterium]|nr:dienelactone hydrolase family protein [Chloroflexota bacterium]
MTTRRRSSYEGMLAETVIFAGHGGDTISGYLARPLGQGLFPGVIVIHEVFGPVEHMREVARRFASHGYVAIAPDLHWREGPGDPTDIAARVRAGGGVPDERCIGDLEGAATYLKNLPYCTGKLGVIGYCSGGRQTLLFACNTKSVHAAVDCYGGRVVTIELTPTQPKAVIDMITGLCCPLLGLFGASDQNPSPEHVARLEQELKKHNKVYEFKTYPPDTGHGFFADYRPSYRVESAVDGWQRIFDFYGRHLATI